MKLAPIAAVACLLFAASGLGEERLLEQDSQALSDSHELSWRSEPLTVTFTDGTKGSRVLVLQFAPLQKARPELLKVKLILATPVTGDPGAPSESFLSTGGFRDVHLAEKDAIRTMKIVRSIDSVDRPNKNTSRLLEMTAISFAYTLNGDTLTLQGFSKEEPTKWGQLEFTVPETSITFRVQ